MDKRSILALILCLVVMVGYTQVYNLLFPKPQDTEEESASNQDGSTEEPKNGESGEGGISGEPPTDPVEKEGDPTSAGVEDGGPAEDVESPYPRVAGTSEEQISVAGEDIWVEFTNRGASISQLRLKGYTQLAGGDLKNESDWLVLLSEFETGHRSLQLNRSDDEKFGDELWILDGSSAANGYQEVRYRFASGNGLVYQKTFRVPDSGFLLEVEVALINENPDLTGTLTEFALVGAAGLHREGIPWDPTEALGEGAMVSRGAAQSGLQAGLFAVGAEELSLQLDQIALKDLEESGGLLPIQPERKLQWVGVHDFYFAAALDAHDTGATGEFVLRSDRARGIPASLPVAGAEDRRRVQCQLRLTPQIPDLGEDKAERFAFSLYAGPKSRSTLSRDDYLRYRTLNGAGRSYCIFPSYLVDPIVTLFTGVLVLFQGWLGSYGIAIILLTLIVRILMFPITLKQQASMGKYQRAMAKVKPEMDALKEKHKGNAKKMQQEQVALFKKHGMSPFPPLGGCLPMLVTMPVFIGMFYTFGQSIELRHTSFLWITDLAQSDRLAKNPIPIPCPLACIDLTYINILPLLMSVTWVLQGKMQQKNMPKSVDPQMAQQQAMMAYMPAIIGLVLYNYAAGVHLYQFTSSLLGIIEQKWVKKRFLPPEPSPDTSGTGAAPKKKITSSGPAAPKAKGKGKGKR